MRLYPPAWSFSRTAAEDGEPGGWRIEKGAFIAISPWVVHRLPEIWPCPDAFDPGRFEKAAAAARPRFAYIPFGAGPRQCIGTHFAMVEMQLAVARFAQRFRLRVVGSGRIPLKPSVTLRPREAVRVTAEARG